MYISIYGAEAVLCNRDQQEDMARQLHIYNGRILCNKAVNAGYRLEPVLEFDASGLLVLPGIIDTHCTLFNRYEKAMLGLNGKIGTSLTTADHAFAHNGITTAFHSCSYSWDDKVESQETTRQLVLELDTHRSRLAIDHRISLRFEKHYLDELVNVMRWIVEGKVDLLVMTDRLSALTREVAEPSGLELMSRHAGCDTTAFLKRLETVKCHRSQSSSLLSVVAAACHHRKIPVASHGDLNLQQLEDYALHGILINELPRSAWAVRTAIENQATVVLGAADTLRTEPCRPIKPGTIPQHNHDKIFVSKDSPAALFQLPFHLAASGTASLESAWGAVSSRPAMAMGLNDRGRIAPGCRGDVVIVEKAEDGTVRLVATVAAGKLIYCSEPERLNGLHRRQAESHALCA